MVDNASANPEPPVPADISARIQHVFVLMLENRSFDHLFAFSGVPGIQAATSENANFLRGTRMPFAPGAPSQMPTDPGHEFTDVFEQLTGLKPDRYVAGQPYPERNNSGFVSNYATTTTEGTPPLAADVSDIMKGVSLTEQAPALAALAKAFVVCDHWFSSLPGPTWPNRFFVHGASSAGLEHAPSQIELAQWETIDGFTFPKGSIYDRLGSDRYRIYQDETGPVFGRIPQVAALKNLHFWDVHNLSDFEQDLAGDYPYAYTFIEPAYGDVASNTYEGGSSQHPMDTIEGGDRLVARVYNALRNSPLWPKSALIITYDEHGGFYDSVVPGAAPPPNDGADGSLNRSGFDFSIYGVRVPALVVSPWVQQGVDSRVYDHSSVLKTLEQLFGLAPLTDRDAQANHLLHLFGGELRTNDPNVPAKL